MSITSHPKFRQPASRLVAILAKRGSLGLDRTVHVIVQLCSRGAVHLYRRLARSGTKHSAPSFAASFLPYSRNASQQSSPTILPLWPTRRASFIAVSPKPQEFRNQDFIPEIHEIAGPRARSNRAGLWEASIMGPLCG